MASTLCDCGKPKDRRARTCRACYAASREVDGTPGVRAHRNWRNRHREHVRAYAREYMRRFRAKEGVRPFYDRCDCGRRKEITRAACCHCDDAKRVDMRRAPRNRRWDKKCWGCGSTMRSATWHGTTFLRCPGCGLEVKGPPMYVTEAA